MTTGQTCIEHRGCKRAYDATPRLGQLAGLPTLVLSGAHDRIARPDVGQAMAAAIPGARYVEFADGSHGLPIQHAARVNALLVEHFSQVDGLKRASSAAP